MVNPELYEDSKSRMRKALDSMRKDFQGIRTGRATPAILDSIRVSVYGQEMPIKQLASISVPEARMIVIQPWDKGSLSEVEKAIQKSDLGINPTNDGKLLRLISPPLTEERWKDLVKQVKKRGEECKVAIRNVRRDALDFLKEMEKEGDISEDDHHRGQEEFQKLTDEISKEVDKIAEMKEVEIMEI
jgi:ribosome recycling factor